MPQQRPTLLFVHGAWHGAWAWEPLRAILEAEGWDTFAIDLPSVHAEDQRGVTMFDDARAVEEAIEGVDGPVVVVAHSYGGVPVTQAAEKAQHIVYIAAFALDVGESLLGAVGGRPPSWWTIDGPLSTPGNERQTPTELFFADVDPAGAADAVSRLRAQSVLPFSDELTKAAWRTVPSTYIVAEDDAAGPAAAEHAMAERIGAAVVSMPTSHSPFLSRPDEVARVVIEAASR